MDLFGKHLLCTQEWSKDELDRVLELSARMKKFRFSNHFANLLRNRTFFMFFFNPSVRTRQSFECAATELGGHAQFLEPKSMRLKTKKSAGETVEDAAKVMSRYACGLGMRILEDKLCYYGHGDEILREYASFSTIPVVSMAHDRFHPCQGLADIMGIKEHLGEDLKKKKILITWAHGALARSHCSVQEAMLICSRYGMDVTVAHPKGYELDEEVLTWTRENCKANEAEFQLVHDPVEGYKGAHVVYSRNWMSAEAYKNDEFCKEAEIEKAMKHKEWICNKEKMALGEEPFFTHPMPIDRGHEVDDETASGPRSIIYDVAENRLHVQKAVMALTMGTM